MNMFSYLCIIFLDKNYCSERKGLKLKMQYKHLNWRKDVKILLKTLYKLKIFYAYISFFLLYIILNYSSPNKRVSWTCLVDGGLIECQSLIMDSSVPQMFNCVFKCVVGEKSLKTTGLGDDGLKETLRKCLRMDSQSKDK